MSTIHHFQNILVIDDDHDDFTLIKEAVNTTYPDVDVHHISSCKEVSNYNGALPDIIFLDLNMPDYDGFHWLNSIRDKGYNDLPVVVFTTSSNAQHIIKAYRNGANLFFTKPSSFRALQKGIQKILELNWKDPAQVTRHFFNEGKCMPLLVA
jgi:DNA-binding response OmpR family regulator